MTFKFGRKRPLVTGPLIKFKHFLTTEAPPPPPVVDDWVKGASAPIYGSMEDILGNDKYGDCTCAGAGHILDGLRANTEKDWVPANTEDTLHFYSQVTSPPFMILPGGFAINDNGADEITVLNTWAQKGFFKDGTGKIAGYASVDPTNIDECKQAVYLFGNVYFGIELPDAWVNPVPSASGFVWDVAGDPNPNQGHCVIGYGYNEQGIFIDTWGMFGTITWAAVAAYCTSAAGGALYTVLGQDWENQATQKAPNGLNYVDLTTYLKTLFH